LDISRWKDNQIDLLLIDRSGHSSVLDIQVSRAADCDTGHCLVVAKVGERLAVSKQTMHRFHTERFNLKKLMRYRVKRSILLS
jgi:hypothetical protein